MKPLGGRDTNMNWRETVVGLRRLILLKLFRPRPPRPAGKEPSAAEIAAVIVEFIRLVDRANGVFGRDAAVGFIKHHPLGIAGLTIDAGRLSGYFEPQVRPLAPDFRFEFSEDHEGTIKFTVLGDYRYEGFVLSGDLTRSGTMDARKNAPTPRLNAHLWGSSGYARNPVTRHAKRLRKVFMSDYGATDYREMFRTTVGGR
jgi:hypothetical protein